MSSSGLSCLPRPSHRVSALFRVLRILELLSSTIYCPGPLVCLLFWISLANNTGGPYQTSKITARFTSSEPDYATSDAPTFTQSTCLHTGFS